MTSNAIRALFAVVLLLCLLTAPVAAQDATPTDEPVATQAPIPTDAPVIVEEPVAPVSDLDRLYDFAENVMNLAVAIILGGGIVLTGGAIVMIRHAISALKFITSLTPSKRDDLWAKAIEDAVNARYAVETNTLIDRRLNSAPAPVEPHHEPGRNN